MKALKPISDETKLKILQYAAAIINEHGSIAGDRCCQDWSIDPKDIQPPEQGFSKEEKQDIAFNYEQHNSNGYDYDPDFVFFHDEMSVSFMLADALHGMIKDIHDTK